MGYNAENDRFSGAWDYYGEQLVMYFLAAGSPTHPIEKKVYNGFTRSKVSYGGYEVIHSWFGSIFTYQFSHAFVDFRGMVDEKGVNWFDNSINATLASHAYAQDMSKDYKTLKDGWGLTACDGPDGYSGLYGSAPSGSGSSAHLCDGTVPPCGAIGSIAFTPTLVMETMDRYYEMLDGKLVGKYGFVDAFNLENKQRWIAEDVIGIDKGVSLLMIENYRSGLVWELFMDCDYIETAIGVLGFQPDETPAEPYMGLPE